jgi:putative ABC transport system ATP-binding protein
MIRTENLCKLYNPHSKHEVRALTDINLHIRKGSFAVFSGPSGSGKTTLLNIIGTLDRPVSGKVFLYGEDVTVFSDIALSVLRRDKIGFIFQDFNLIPRLSSIENVGNPLLPLGVRAGERFRRSRAILERMGLDDRLNHRPEELSGGQQQRVAIARALVNNPDIIIADEPTSSIDEDAGTQLIETMKNLKSNGTTILVATHDTRFNDIADEIFIIKGGRFA